jgi:hypothetical protein
MYFKAFLKTPSNINLNEKNIIIRQYGLLPPTGQTLAAAVNELKKSNCNEKPAS